MSKILWEISRDVNINITFTADVTSVCTSCRLLFFAVLICVPTIKRYLSICTRIFTLWTSGGRAGGRRVFPDQWPCDRQEPASFGRKQSKRALHARDSDPNANEVLPRTFPFPPKIHTILFLYFFLFFLFIFFCDRALIELFWSQLWCVVLFWV